ncbi:MAG: hypothetical protein ACPGFC_09860, partial [Paracoccaceae bacterium]
MTDFKRLGDQWRMGTTPAGDSLSDDAAPKTVALSGGGYASVWHATPDAAPTRASDVYLRIIAPDGHEVQAGTQVNHSADAAQTQPDVVQLADGRLLVTWTSAEQGSADLGIWGRIYDVTGQPVTGDLALVVHPGGVRHDARSVARADGGFTLVYTESSGQDGSFDGVYTRSFGQDATPLGDEARVNVHTSDRQFDPEIAALDTGMIAVWSGSVPGDTSSHGIVGRFLGDDGTPVGSAFVLNTTTFNTQYGPRVTRTEDGFAVAWTTFATATASWEVVYQRFLANGSLVGPQLQVNTTHVGHQEVQDILALSD